jgi:LisH domain-containing protein ARMC9
LANENNRRKLLLLQALRWRLTKAESLEERRKSLDSLILNDILDQHPSKQSEILKLLKSQNEMIREFMARFLNTLASLYHG